MVVPAAWLCFRESARNGSRTGLSSSACPIGLASKPIAVNCAAFDLAGAGALCRLLHGAPLMRKDAADRILPVPTGAVFLWQSERQRKASGLPSVRVIYMDTANWRKPEKPLYDPILGLVGRPDYLVEQGNMIIPVEVKSRPAPLAPYDSHIYQLMAYCLLVERTFGRRPAYGILHYADMDFAIEYTPEREQALLDLLAEMQRDHLRTSLPRSHEEPARCLRCGFREICEARLA